MRIRIGAPALLLGIMLHAQNIAGDWQGTLQAGPQPVRGILRIAKGDNGAWSGTLFMIDQVDWGAGIPVNSLMIEGSNLKFTLDIARGSYQGKLTGDGASIVGTWTQGQTQPLEFRRATPETAWRDTAPHTVQFVTVDKDVKLEVLDWGGSGRPLVLLTGLGNTAHIFDKFAPKLTPTYHVYGITRRGIGLSSAPEATSANYAADRLGQDVIAVIDALKLNRPVLAGHSLAGEELSSVGSRHPEMIAGLIYLDAGYSYAYYDSSQGDLPLDRTQPKPSVPTVGQAIQAGMQRYTDIRGPILAIYALPHDRGLVDPAARAAADASDIKLQGAQARAFEKGLPSARVIWLAHANHYVFQSNEADVLREMVAFISGLP